MYLLNTWEQAWEILKKKLLILKSFFKPCKVYHFDQVQRHFYVSMRLEKNHHKKESFYQISSKEEVVVVGLLRYQRNVTIIVKLIVTQI